MKKNALIIILIIFFTVPVLLPLFRSGFFVSDDGEWMIIRFSAFYQALADGQFPVRFLSRLNHEYGYPVANFLYPGFMYIGIPIKLLGFSFVETIKIIFSLSMMISTIFTYLWLSRIFGKWSSFVGSIVYLYVPYHLFDLYKRGSVGELLALAIIPFVLWQVERKSIFWSSIGVSMLILFHNTLALLFLPIIIVYIVLKLYKEKYRKWSLIYQYTSILVLGLGLSSFFWIPALFDLQYTVFFQTKVSEWQNHFAPFSLVGISSIAILGTTLSFLIRTRTIKQPNSNDSNHRNISLVFFMFGIGMIGIFLSTQASISLWRFLPVSFIQFPFRFLSLAVLSTAFLSAFLLDGMKEGKKVLTTVLFIILFISAMPYIKPDVFFDKGEGFYATNMGTTTVRNEHMPKWVKVIPAERANTKVTIADGIIEKINLQSNKITFTANANSNTKTLVNIVYFPGWIVSIDGIRASISYENDMGIMEAEIPRGRHIVEFKFIETPIRLFSDIVSFITFLGLVFYGLQKKLKKLYGK